jgi:hypothetical protein
MKKKRKYVRKVVPAAGIEATHPSSEVDHDDDCPHSKIVEVPEWKMNFLKTKLNYVEQLCYHISDVMCEIKNNIDLEE